MCGLFSLLNYDGISIDRVQKNFIKSNLYSLENSAFYSFLNMILGTHNLSTNAIVEFDGVILICDGIIYNYKQLYSLLNITPTTDLNYEVIIHLFIKYGIQQTLQMLNGVFSFILYDARETTTNKQTLYVARDALGLKPLYYLSNLKAGYLNDDMLGFATELRCLYSLVFVNPYQYKVEHFKPGTYSTFEISLVHRATWKSVSEHVFYTLPFSYTVITNIHTFVNKALSNSVNNWCDSTIGPVACLLSGNLDSNLIAWLVNDYCKQNKREFETFSIGLTDSTRAKIVAGFLQTKHTDIIVTEDDMFNAIEDVIYTIESCDVKAVKASVNNYLLAKHISIHSNAKVIFNGEGATELCGGKCKDEIDFDKESRNSLTDSKDTNKCFSSHGLEPISPFLDRNFVDCYLSLPPSIRKYDTIEMSLLRNSFTSILPDEILWQGNEINCLSFIEKMIEEYYSTKGHSVPEKMYYKQIFDKYYPYSSHMFAQFKKL